MFFFGKYDDGDDDDDICVFVNSANYF